MGAWIETYTGWHRLAVSQVAPFMGAWIETLYQALVDNNKGLLPLWGHGLKLLKMYLLYPVTVVAPFMGAWIETTSL